MVPHGTIETVHTITHPKTRCRKPYAATKYLMLLMMGVCTRNMSSKEYINKITLLHQVGISIYFIGKTHGQTTLTEVRKVRGICSTCGRKYVSITNCKTQIKLLPIWVINQIYRKDNTYTF